MTDRDRGKQEDSGGGSQRENLISIRVPKESLVLATQGRCATNGVAWFMLVICHVFLGSIPLKGIYSLELSGE